MRKFDLLFPRAAAYLENPGHFNLNQRTEGLDNYYADLSSLQNLSALSRQINSDLCNLSDHKYIAHQMAILYVSNLLTQKANHLVRIKHTEIVCK